MARRPGRDLTVGAVVALALLIFAAAVMMVGEESKLFRTKERYTVTFPDSKGLRVGSPVNMSGVTVGSVTKIYLPTEPDSPGIEVTIGIAREYAPRVREDSWAALRWLQILSGEKFIEVRPGNPELPPIPPGETIPPLVEREIFEQSADVAQNLNDITVSLKKILVPLERGEGLLGRLIHDPEFGTPAVDSMGRVLGDLEHVTAEIRAGRGFVGRLLYDREFATTVDDLAGAVKSFRQLAERLEGLEGDLRSLLEEDGPVREGIDNFSEATASLNRTLKRLESRDNLMGRMLSDEEYAEKVSRDIETLVHNLAEISDKLNSGDGTLGALITERALYEGLEEFVAGVNDSKFARWLMRRYQKKGIKAAEKEAAAGESTPGS